MCSLCGTDKDIEYIARNGILEYEFCTPCWDFLSTIVENNVQNKWSGKWKIY